MDVALREWSAVVEALLRGDQTLLLRKGGLVEGKHGFHLLHPRFLLLPTYLHQHRSAVREPFLPLWDQAAARPGDQQVLIAALGQAELICRAPAEMASLAALGREHIYSDEFLQQRLSYRPDLPLMLVMVRVYRLRKPQWVPLRPSYAGCKSWINLTDDVPVEGLQAVLSDEAFAERSRQVLMACATA